jgi:hypothetical protein
MLVQSITSLFLAATLSIAFPLNPRLVKLDEAATREAQQRDNTATRTLTGTQIKVRTSTFYTLSCLSLLQTSDGRCLFVQNGSGDFRNNLNPVQVGKCDGSEGQKWDVIVRQIAQPSRSPLIPSQTKGKHNDQKGVALIVNGLTQACLNFDPRRRAGNTVIMFSCGGRADGNGQVTDSQVSGTSPLTRCRDG